LTSQVTLKSVQLNVIKPAQSLLNQQMQALITLENIIQDPNFLAAGPVPDWTDPLTPPQNTPLVGCRLKPFAGRWEYLFGNSLPTKWVRDGVPLNFLETAPLVREPVEYPIGHHLKGERQLAVKNLLAKGAIEVIHKQTSPGLYHRLFLRPKPDNTWRPIIDLSPLNLIIHNESFKMETPHSIRQAVQQGEHILQLDLKDAYFQIPIMKKYRKYMRFCIGGVIYQFRCLPFSLNIAPRIFTKILKPILAIIRKAMIPVHAYLDDWILRLLYSHTLAPRIAHTVVTLLRLLGWIVNFPKSNFLARQHFTYIGLEWNLNEALIHPGREKIKDLRAKVKQARPGIPITAKKLAGIVGVIKWMAPYVPLGLMRLKRIQHLIKLKWSQSKDGWHARITTDRTLHTLLQWWTRQPNITQGVPLHPPIASLAMFTDASGHGWGAIMGDMKASGEWTHRLKDRHINYLELEAVFRGLKEFATAVENRVVKVHSDNSTTVACLRKQGSLSSPALNSLTARLLRWTTINNTTVQPIFIQGYRNVEADALSRKDLTHASEWTLSNQEFHRIVNWSKLLPPSVDLMATSVNRKVDTFISPYPHPEALAVDALSTSWELPGTLWLYPPTALMTKVISKIRETNSITLILIAPDQPTRAWYPDLLSLTHRRTREVGRRKDTIIQHVPHLEEPITLEEPETLKLKAWIIQK